MSAGPHQTGAVRALPVVNAVNGPFNTDREAHHAALSLGGPPRPGWSILSSEQSNRMLTGASSRTCNGTTRWTVSGAWERRASSW